jgi:hypothetical protein
MFGGLPESDKVVILAFFVPPHLENVALPNLEVESRNE